VGIVDPHGDLCETILDYIRSAGSTMSYTLNHSTLSGLSLNVLEIKNKQHKDLISSGIVSIFSKLYKDSWGPRLEYILRNVILTLLETPEARFPMSFRFSRMRTTEKGGRAVAGSRLEKLLGKGVRQNAGQAEGGAISPIQNKVGQFVTSRMIRNIVGKPKSSIDLEEIMNSGKILLLNLSQGKLGEDNAALLGAMIITQIQLAAMNRSFIKEHERKDFFLYVDEFQNSRRAPSSKSFPKRANTALHSRLPTSTSNSLKKT
jgi:hypothetical protein